MFAKPHVLVLALGLGLLSSGNERAIAQNLTPGYPTPEAAFRGDVLQNPYRSEQDFIEQYLSIDPVVQAGDYAIASVVYGEGGGVSIAHQVDGNWNVICGTGGAFSRAQEIQEFCNIPQAEAQFLWLAWLDAIEDGRPATVFDPPSNVRNAPNGEIVCSINEPTTIMTYGEMNGWYYTSACGGILDVIHSSQIRF